MDFRKLGWSDIEVLEISLGSWLTYSGGVGREQHGYPSQEQLPL